MTTQPRTIADDLRGTPRYAGLEVILEAVAGLTALSGGLTLALAPDGRAAGLPLALLEGSGFSSYLVPGVILALVGAISLAAAGLTLVKSQLATPASMLTGAALVLFTLVEQVATRHFHLLQLVMLALGLAIIRLSLPEENVRP